MINQYRIIKSLNRGTYGVVRLAVDTTTDTQYVCTYKAIKIFKVDSLKNKKEYSNCGGKMIIHTAYELVEQEFIIIKKLNHANIIKFKEILYHDEIYRIYLGTLVISDGICRKRNDHAMGCYHCPLHANYTLRRQRN